MNVVSLLNREKLLHLLCWHGGIVIQKSAVMQLLVHQDHRFLEVWLNPYKLNDLLSLILFGAPFNRLACCDSNEDLNFSVLEIFSIFSCVDV